LLLQVQVPPPQVPPPVAAAPISRPSGPPRAVVIGQVVEADSGRPIPKSVVRLASAQVTVTRLTDDKGRFYFRDIPPGEVSITAERRGYFDGAFGKRRATGLAVPLALTGGQSIADMRLELFRAGTISGVVVDDGNEPAVGVDVIAFRREHARGRWQLVEAATDTTDDRGDYRLTGLLPGDYVVSVPFSQTSVPASLLEAVAATGSAGGPLTSLVMRQTARGGVPPPPSMAEHFAFVTEFYPGGDRPSLAEVIPIAPGQHRAGVFFHLRARPAFPLQGVVVGPDGPRGNQLVRLRPDDVEDVGTATEVGATVSDGAGRFLFADVPAGRYVIEARSHAPPLPGAPRPVAPPAQTTAEGSPPAALWGTRVIEHTGTDDRWAVEMRAGSPFGGELRFVGGARPPAGTEQGRVTISLVPVDRDAIVVPPIGVTPEGRILGAGIPPGDYHVRIDSVPAGWFVQSAAADGANAVDRPLSVTDSGGVTLVVTLADRGTEVTGAVRDARGLPLPAATVVAFPAPRDGGGPDVNPFRTREVRADMHGVFKLVGLPPGDYLLVPMDDRSAHNWQHPDRLAALAAAGTRVALRSADRRVVDLRLK
jgi:hypothetical protein